MFNFNSLYSNQELRPLENLVLMTNKDTLPSIFYTDDSIDYNLLMKKILLPYFKIKRRIIEKATQFKIGEIGFKVYGTSPYGIGLVTSRTFIHCTKSFSSQTKINRALMITTSRYNDFRQEALINEILKNTEHNLIISKNEVFSIRNYEFYVRNCEPESGVLTKESLITVENKEINRIVKIKLAIIKVSSFYYVEQCSRISKFD